MARGKVQEVNAAVMEVGGLKAALGTVSSAIERRTTIPILANVALEFQPESVSVWATNMDMQISRQVPCEAKASWSVAVPGHVLKAVVDKLPSDSEVRLTIDGAQLLVTCGRTRVKLAALPIADMVSLKFGDNLASFEMPGAELLAMIGHVKHAISTDETRYYLNGILIQRREAMLLFVTTDGYRLAKVERAAPDGSEALALEGALSDGVIVPRAAVPVIEQIAKEQRVTLHLASNRLSVEGGETVLTTKLVDGTFPDWTRVVPSHFDGHAVLPLEDTKAALARVAAVSTEKTRAVRMDIAEGLLTASVTCAETGTATEEVPVELNGQPITIGFNASYLAGILDRMMGDEVQMSFGDSAAPSLWRLNPDATDIHVLMPMRV